ncbi:MAG: DUF368 domain-containing protein [Clostridia bacterium]|nr:DUF368 domain-containing protein [Clostridia bacterium]
MVKNDVRRTGMKAFFTDVLSGICIGVAFIIPGFSGGSVAAILGIYERLISAIADILKDFKSSIKTLLPIGVGMIVGIISLLYPLSWALSEFPIPTVSLFVGLAIGGLPSITEKLKNEKIKYTRVIPFVLAMLLVISISFMPIGTDKNLLSLSIGGYILLFVIGILSSSALVIPGISGSMLLLILGYYNPIIGLVTEHLFLGKDFGTSIIVLMITGIGVIVGFIGISVIMKKLFAKCPKATYAAIFGFIIGSMPTIFVSAAKEANMTFSTLPTAPLYWISSALLLAFGVAVTYALVVYSRKRIRPDVDV